MYLFKMHGETHISPSLDISARGMESFQPFPLLRIWPNNQPSEYIYF